MSPVVTRFLLAISITYFLAVIYHYLLKRSSSKLQSIYFFISGISTLWFVFGSDIWHSVLDVLVVYGLFVIFGPTTLTLIATWLFTMGHLVSGYADHLLSNKIHVTTWTLPHCVLVLKLIGLSFNLYDGRKKEENLTSDQKETLIKSVPSFIDYLGYCYFFGTVLAGPQISFRRYHSFISGNLYDVSKSHNSFYAGLQKMGLGLCVAAVYYIMNTIFPIQYILSEEYTKHNILERLFIMGVTAIVSIHKYILVWLLVEGACIITGISYNGKNPDGEDDWSATENIKLLDFELSTGMQGIAESFNISTNNWVKCYVYKRLKWLKSRELSALMAMLFLAIWHGIWFGYFAAFVTEFLYILEEDQIALVFQKRFGIIPSKLSGPKYIIIMTVAYIIWKFTFLSYMFMLFLLLSWEDCYQFMRSTYFVGHIGGAIWLLVYHAFLKPKNKLN